MHYCSTFVLKRLLHSFALKLAVIKSNDGRLAPAVSASDMSSLQGKQPSFGLTAPNSCQYFAQKFKFEPIFCPHKIAYFIFWYHHLCKAQGFDLAHCIGAHWTCVVCTGAEVTMDPAPCSQIHLIIFQKTVL